VHLAHFSEGPLCAPDGAAHYLRDVLRLKDGARVLVFGDGAEAEAIVSLAADGAVTLTVSAKRPAAARRPVTLLYALAKGDKVDAVVRDATELGVTHIMVFAAERSVVRLEDDRAAKRTERRQKIAEEAARQSGRADPPELTGPLLLADAVQRVQAAHKWLLHPAAASPLGERLLPALTLDSGLAFAVGPEGGFSDRELGLAVASGFEAVSFGTTTLRTETVPAAVLGALAVLGP
jgi:16S rRNA (uracil1498-N3)-methyltransferase